VVEIREVNFMHLPSRLILDLDETLIFGMESPPNFRPFVSEFVAYQLPAFVRFVICSVCGRTLAKRL
jgi:hypothetical protein